MGKAKRKLKEQRNEGYEPSQELIDYTEDNEEEYEKQQEYMYETATIIRERLINYADKCNLPLCEFLDFLNVENYVKWLLKEG